MPRVCIFCRPWHTLCNGGMKVARSEHAACLSLVLRQLLWQEAMRVRPVASTGTTRLARKDLLLGGHLIPAGTMLMVPFDGVHHYAGNWPNQPDAFIPVRPLANLVV